MKWLREIILFCFGFSSLVQAQAPLSGPTSDLVERSFAGVSREANLQMARKDIMDQAALNVSEDLIKELVGEERFAKNKSMITAKVIRNASRYIPFSKPGEISPEGPGFKMAVTIKVSLRDLKTMLQENGLLNQNESSPVILPVLSFVDRVNMKIYRWWQTDRENKTFLIMQGRNFENALRNSFQRSGFYLMKPQENAAFLDIPTAFQNEKVGGEDAQFFGQYFNASVLLDGQVTITKNVQPANSYRIELRLTASQISNARPIADVSRKVDTEAGSFEAVVDKRMKELADSASNDLSGQVLEAWQRGSLGTSIIRITLRGNSSLLAMEHFKERLKDQIPQIRNVRERLFEAGRYSFEVDTSASAAELVQKLQNFEIEGKPLKQVSESNNEVIAQIN